MAKGAYIGVNSVAKKIKKAYIGVAGVARKIKKGYIGDANGIARLFYTSGLRMVSGSFTGVTNGTVTINLGFKPTYLLIYGNHSYTSENDFGVPVGHEADIIIYNAGTGQATMMAGSAIGVNDGISLSTVLTVTSAGFKFKDSTDVTGLRDGNYQYFAFEG